MKLFNLGHVPWLDSQLIYHALPRTGIEGLILLAPAEPYVCIGYHQDAEQEVDLAYCREHAIPVFRREVGGGAVYLDGQQLFYQLVIHKDNPLAHGDIGQFYERFLAPVAKTYAELGVQARYKPVNDIVTLAGRKISGNGAAEIEDYRILVGNLIVDFDYETMVRILRVPDAKFRDKVFKSMRENLTTIRRELEGIPAWEAMTAALIRNFESVLGPLQPDALPEAVYGEMATLAQTFTTEEWLLQPGRRIRGRQREQNLAREIKISADISVAHRLHKAPGGLIRADVETQQEKILSVGLSGDFFFYPADLLAELERALSGVPLSAARETIAAYYRAQNIESPGVTPDDFAAALGADVPAAAST